LSRSSFSKWVGSDFSTHAPFPKAIPKLLTDILTKDSVILDPFGGSLTSGIVAVENGLKAICIEKSAEYCALGLKIYGEEIIKS
jgi:DNA modification methylase